MPKLSIITINYNNCAGLRKTINSVVAQTFTDYEWIVIDGGSTDGSKELIEENSSQFSFWCSEPDKGIYNAMNKGIDHANGEYYQFLNSGDAFINSHVLEKVFSCPSEADLLYGDYKLGNHAYVKSFPEEITISYLLDDCINHQASFYKKTLFSSYRYDESFKIVSDWAYYFTLLLSGKTFQHLPFVIVEFEPDGVGSYFTEEHLNERTKAIEKYVPRALHGDLNLLKKYNFIKTRKSFKLMMSFAYSLCKFIDPLLQKLDKKKLIKR